ncbi:hypothetical protein SS50377_25468 [Spironucleus salmonicida]|uniref:Uncharacterized protein n=1 Tax=Spironucleus salmonicida TaxID=348837 RepID=V6LMS6_9EUKA|nr:hypothetical protein SS50377_25468 [Spironucleus salmonicida]|eukprot:EST45016.1 Hypothetical protein SS50377_15035 [Spironucleus salmonicida]
MNQDIICYKNLAKLFDLVHFLKIQDNNSTITSQIESYTSQYLDVVLFASNTCQRIDEIYEKILYLTENFSVDKCQKQLNICRKSQQKIDNKYELDTFLTISKECMKQYKLIFRDYILQNQKDKNYHCDILVTTKQFSITNSSIQSVYTAKSMSIKTYKEEIQNQILDTMQTFLQIFNYYQIINFQQFIPILKKQLKGVSLPKILFMKYKINTRVIKKSLDADIQILSKIAQIQEKAAFQMMLPLNKDLITIFGLETSPKNWIKYLQNIKKLMDQKYLNLSNFIFQAQKIEEQQRLESDMIKSFFGTSLIRDDIQATVRKYFYSYEQSFGVGQIERFLPQSRNFQQLDFNHIKLLCQEAGFRNFAEFIQNELELALLEKFQEFGFSVRLRDLQGIQSGVDIQVVFIALIDKQFGDSALLMETLLAFNLKTFYNLIFQNLLFNKSYNTLSFVFQDLNNTNVTYLNRYTSLEILQKLSRFVRASPCLQQYSVLFLAENISRKLILDLINGLFEGQDYMKIEVKNEKIKNRLIFYYQKYDKLDDLYREMFEYLKCLMMTQIDIDLSCKVSYLNFIGNE